MAVHEFTLLAAGHAANGDAPMFVQGQNEGNDDCSFLLKPVSNSELQAYERLSTTYASDPVHKFIPAFHGVQHGCGSVDSAFLRMSNLVDGFKNPTVMDVKLGMRTSLQSEAQNSKPRKDLFQKMQKDCPSELTAAELETQTVTKSRYMMTRDARSTSGSLGYRVSGTAGCNTDPGTTSNCRVAMSEDKDAARSAFRQFAQSASTYDVKPSKLAMALVEQLRDLRAALEASQFVRDHECVGTSVLLAIDSSRGTCRAFWIDFAKTCACKDQRGLSHREPLHAESQEEGLLLGLDNLINDWEAVAQNLEAPRRLERKRKNPACCNVMARFTTQIDQMFGFVRSKLTDTVCDVPPISSKLEL